MTDLRSPGLSVMSECDTRAGIVNSNGGKMCTARLITSTDVVLCFADLNRHVKNL